MPNPMILRPALPDDAPALAALGRDAFVAAFGQVYDPADLATFLDEVHDVDAVAGEITDPSIMHRLAEDPGAGTLIGFVKLKQPGWYGEYSDATNPISLGQLYTAPQRTGQGIGAALMEWAIGEARALGCDAIQLSVWSENTGAQAFYQRYGFAKIADIDFWVGNHRDDEFLYELRL
jgi:diamine N-acetyltransferase